MKRKKSDAGGQGVSRRDRDGQHREKGQNPLRQLEELLVAAVRDLYGDAAAGSRDVHLHLNAVVRPHKGWRLEAEPAVREQVKSAVMEATAKEQIFRPGRVYCYRCESSHCAHSVPPAPESVFGGYSSTGVPQWPELIQILLERRHPGAYALYGPSERSLAAVFVDSDSLKHHQLGVFGRRSKTYDILGQVVFGFLRFDAPGGGGHDQERIAVTLQAVEVRVRSRRPRVVLNVIGSLSDGSAVVDSLDGPFQLRILDAITTARRLVSRLRPSPTAAGGTKGSPRGGGVAGAADGIMRRTARTLQKLGRQSVRRTVHAERRRTESRPTAKARQDLAGAPDSNLFWDGREETVVVLGPRLRVHVFSPGGRHITSLFLTKSEVESRKRRSRWRILDAERRRSFRKAFYSGAPDSAEE